MNSKAIETIAVNAIKDSVVTVDVLEPYITENDKGPSWDGYIYIYNDEKHTKNNLRGKVAVQVKGVLSTNLAPSNITFSAEIADLKNYKNDCGTIYFVVYIDKNDLNHRKIYYEALTPVKVDNYLKKTNAKKWKTIELKEFPTDDYKKASIVLNLFEHSKKQMSFASQGFISLEELNKQGIPYTYTMTVDGYGDISTPDLLYSTLFENDVYVYVSHGDSNVLIPTDTVIKSLMSCESVQCDIFVNGVCYYKKFERVRSLGKTVIKIGDSLSFVLNTNDKGIKVNIELASELRKRARDLSFLIEAAKNQSFYLQDKEVAMPIPIEDLETFNINLQRNLLTYYNKIICMLDMLHVECDIDLKLLTEQEKKNIDILVKAIVDNEYITGINMGTTPRILNLKLAGVTLKLFINKSDDGNSYSVKDFFHLESSIIGEDKNGQQMLLSPFSILQEEDYLKISNIDYDAILASYKTLADIDIHTYERANFDMLNMLKAYDEKSNTKLLEVAKSIAEWIYHEDQNLSKDIALINILQIVKRERDLNKDEYSKLYIMLENQNLSDEMKVAIYLLLKNQIAAEIYFNRLDVKQQEIFKSYPIYRFWDK